MRVAVIPARGGSKRIPRKNIKDFHGRPMIAWSIQTALDSGCFDRIIVSTDDEAIAEVARNWGAEVPFTRPAELANDRAGTIPVIQHAIQWLSNAGKPAHTICCLYATAPFARTADIREGLTRLEHEHCDFALAVTEYPYPIQRALRLNDDGRMAMFQPENFDKRSQDLEPAFHDAGQFYWGTSVAWQSGKPLLGTHSSAIVLPSYRVQDIDTLDDWRRAEMLFKLLQNEGL